MASARDRDRPHSARAVGWLGLALAWGLWALLAAIAATGGESGGDDGEGGGD